MAENIALSYIKENRKLKRARQSLVNQNWVSPWYFELNKREAQG